MHLTLHKKTIDRLPSQQYQKIGHQNMGTLHPILFLTLPDEKMPETTDSWDFFGEILESEKIEFSNIENTSLFSFHSRGDWYVYEITKYLPSDHILHFLETTLWTGKRLELLSAVSELSRILSLIYHSPPRDVEEIQAEFNLADFRHSQDVGEKYYYAFFSCMNCMMLSMTEAIAKNHTFIYYHPPV